ncbi:hypothetical protein ACFC0S_03060 [Streptomyces sp. NPDC056084]|uniref:hypothetical protein n=1 Tax=unclassified Streptomyces TaxID=2593676 RepID=UPI0035D85806
MTDESFPDEWTEETQLSLREDPDGYVELSVGPAPGTGESLRAYPLAVLLSPETARRLARAVTLTTFRLEGEDVTDAVPEPCPDTAKPCVTDCPLRRACRDSALEDIYRADLEDGTHPPTLSPMVLELSPEERFLEARELAGPAASLDDVLRLAAFLKEG